MSTGPGMLGTLDHPALDAVRTIVSLRDEARIRPGLTRRSVLGPGGLSQTSTVVRNNPLGIRGGAPWREPALPWNTIILGAAFRPA